MTTGMCHGDDERLLLHRDECNLIWESRQIGTPVTCGTRAPPERVLNDGCAGALDLVAETNPETGRARLVVAGDALDLRGCLREELQDKAHQSGAICRSRAKTSPAGIGLDSPALKRATRRTISAPHTASAPGSGSRSTLSKSLRASARRWSGGSTRASWTSVSSVAGMPKRRSGGCRCRISENCGRGSV